MTIRGLLAGAYQLLKENPRALIIWAIAHVLVFAVLIAAAGPTMLSMMQQAELQQQMGAQPGLPPGFGMIVLLELLYFAWLLAFYAAVVRTARDGKADRFGSLRLGMDELRLVGLFLLFILVFILAEIAALLIGFICIGGVSLISTTLAGYMTILYAVVLFSLLVWFHVRISLIGPVTVLRGTFAIREGWRASKPHFWTLLGTFALLFGVILVLECVVLALFYPDILKAIFGLLPPEEAAANTARLAEQMSKGLPAIFWVFLPVGAIFGTAITAYFCAVVSVAAVRALGLERAEAPAEG